MDSFRLKFKIKTKTRALTTNIFKTFRYKLIPLSVKIELLNLLLGYSSHRFNLTADVISVSRNGLNICVAIALAYTAFTHAGLTTR